MMAFVGWIVAVIMMALFLDQMVRRKVTDARWRAAMASLHDAKAEVAYIKAGIRRWVDNAND